MTEPYFYFHRECYEWVAEADTASEFKKRFMWLCEYAFDRKNPPYYVPNRIIELIDEGVERAEIERNGLERKTIEYKRWRMNVFQRDNFTCQICGQVGGELNAHHIKPFAKYPEERLSLSNGITLCKQCHVQLHREMRKQDEE